MVVGNEESIKEAAAIPGMTFIKKSLTLLNVFLFADEGENESNNSESILIRDAVLALLMIDSKNSESALM